MKIHRKGKHRTGRLAALIAFLVMLLTNTAMLLTAAAQESGSAAASDPPNGQSTSFAQFLADSWIFVIVFICVVFVVILILLRQKMNAERKASEQQRLLEEAEEINELKQTISSLLDNMPGMSFTKDAGSGVYLACNQAFADYAKKASPDDVLDGAGQPGLFARWKEKMPKRSRS